jgi:hypothetical protein|tara:strand:+ start:4152 stop:5270 length:1119 start_codon:yes stop_codon:yes gene_type:complete
MLSNFAMHYVGSPYFHQWRHLAIQPDPRNFPATGSLQADAIARTLLSGTDDIGKDLGYFGSLGMLLPKAFPHLEGLVLDWGRHNSTASFLMMGNVLHRIGRNTGQNSIFFMALAMDHVLDNYKRGVIGNREEEEICALFKGRSRLLEFICRAKDVKRSAIFAQQADPPTPTFLQCFGEVISDIEKEEANTPPPEIKDKTMYIVSGIEGHERDTLMERFLGDRNVISSGSKSSKIDQIREHVELGRLSMITTKFNNKEADRIDTNIIDEVRDAGYNIASYCFMPSVTNNMAIRDVQSFLRNFEVPYSTVYDQLYFVDQRGKVHKMGNSETSPARAVSTNPFRTSSYRIATAEPIAFSSVDPSRVDEPLPWRIT